MRVLVTGGAGFIGSNFVRRTLQQQPDVQVTVLDAFTYAANPASLADIPGISGGSGTIGITSGAGVVAEPGAAEEHNRVAGAPAKHLEVVRGSITDRVLVEGLVADSDLVVHFAAESHNDRSLRDPMSFVRTNVEGTVNLIDAAVKHDVRFHHVSTDEVFGDLPIVGGKRFTPSTPYAPSSPYSASKAASDHMVRAYVRSFGLKATISNCSNNYGPRQHPEKFIPRQVIGLLLGQSPRVYGAGKNVRDWIHVDDHNDAVWTIINEGQVGETYLIGADGERNNLEVVAEINRIFGRAPDDFLSVTDRPGHDRRYAIDPSSTRALGWEPKHDFATGLRQTVEWYANNRSWWEDSYRESEAFYSKQ